MLVDVLKAPKNPSQHLTVKEYFEGIYLKDMKSLRENDMLAPSTYRGYEKDVRLYIAPPPFGNIALGDLNTRVIKLHFQTKIELPGAARTAWKTFRQGINYAVDEAELLDRNPLPKRIKLRELDAYEADVLTVEELAAVFKAFRGHRLEPWILVSAGTGLRRGESCALWWNDIDLETGHIKISKSRQYLDGEIVNRDQTKGGKRRPRIVCLPESIRARLKEIAESRDDLIMMRDVLPLAPDRINFKLRGNPDLLAAEFKRRCAEFGVRHVPPSNLRNTFATILNDQNVNRVDLSNVLGHKRFDMTYEHYIQGKVQMAERMASSFNEAMSDLFAEAI
jgi:integrase